jgi:glycosyltransferase involved in cell wall biosynthesis
MRRDEFQVEPFPSLEQFQPKEASWRALRVCIATEEIYGPVRNGGIASTYYHLARTLAADGHHVTVLYLKGAGQCENMTIEHWIRFYRGLGIKFVPLPMERLPIAGPAAYWQLRYYSFYRWLRLQSAFDIVHTSEWRGGAYYALLAKQQGLAFEDTMFVVKSSSPWIWNRHYTMQTVQNFRQLVCMHAERRTLELGDLVIGGSAHLLNFLRTKGYHLPACTFVQPNIIDLQDLKIEEKRPPYEYGDIVQTGDLVFFGRLEGRKGLDIFCDAVNRLVAEGIQPTSVSFLGKRGQNLAACPEITTVEYISRVSSDWHFPVTVIEDYDQDKAIGYLCEKPRIAVMPSLIENSTMTVYECLVHRVPFLASRVGGTPELIDPSYHDRVLVDPHPESLVSGLRRVLQEGGTVAKGAFEYADNLATWRGFHRFLASELQHKSTAELISEIASTTDGQVLASEAGRQQAPESLRVSLCIYHHRTPALLTALADSLLAQEIVPDEVIVVHDGPVDPDDEEYLAALEKRLDNYDWKFLTTPHRCIGAAWNAAAAEVTGDVLIFLHAERHLAKSGLVGTLRTAAAHSCADLLTSVYDRFDEKQTPKPKNAIKERVVPLGGDLATAFFVREALGGSCFAVRRDTFEALGGFRELYHVGSVEQEFFARAMHQGYELEVVPESLCWERGISPVVSLNEPSGDYLSILPFLEGAPYYMENILLFARQIGQEHHLLTAKLRALQHRFKEVRDERDALQDRQKLLEWGRRLQARLDALNQPVYAGRHFSVRVYLALRRRLALATQSLSGNQIEAVNSEASRSHNPD